jgi:hypothetical protein
LDIICLFYQLFMLSKLAGWLDGHAMVRARHRADPGRNANINGLGDGKLRDNM